MKHLKIILLVSIFCITNSLLCHTQNNDVQLLFKKPALHFTESLPLGNGRLGAMVYGDTQKERIALNEISLWSGGPQEADLEDAHEYLQPIQQLLLSKKNKAAQELLMQHFIARGEGSGGNGANIKYGCYQTMGDVFINWLSAGTVVNYRRILAVDKALATTTYYRDDMIISEEVFADFVQDVIRVKISSTKKKMNFDLSLYRKENVNKLEAGSRKIIMCGQLPAGNDKGMQYATVLAISRTDGFVTAKDSVLKVRNAATCELVISMHTNYDYAHGGLHTNKNVLKAALENIDAAEPSFTKAYSLSYKAYKKYFDRCRLYFPKENKNIDTMSVTERLVNNYNGKKDNELSALYFNFGRYLLISASRPGLLPANLQGIWATEYQTPWNGDYHLNINLQMNYWPADVTNLSALAKPLFQYTQNLVSNGKKTAQHYYRAKGWTAHVISNPWFFTSPGESAKWGSTLTGGAWLTTHFWDYYKFNNDTAFLRKYYPLIKGAAKFLQSILINEKQHGWLVTAPSNSPENTYIMPDGFIGNTCMGPTMDMQICRNIFLATISAAQILQTDTSFAKELSKTTKLLAPNQVSPTNGGIQEWLDDWESAEPQHRHVSHLFGLYPYDEITPWQTPQLANAAAKTLAMRGDGGTGWSKAWKINFHARLGNGDYALKMLRGLLQPVFYGDKTSIHNGGTYSNLFCAHPPFQVDGNFGATAAIAEMLLQSHGQENIIRLLPALPTEWKTGNITGLKARGNFTIDMFWKANTLTKAQITAGNKSVCKILVPKTKMVKDSKGNILHHSAIAESIAVISLQAGDKIFIL